MKRVKLTVAYDGTHYNGWQIQPNGVTIEEILNQKISRLVGESIKIQGASRTDSRVHALGNVAVFDTNTTIPAERISYALNRLLPEDIVIVKSEAVAEDWHPRYNKSVKTYEYYIKNAKIPDPIRRNTHYWVSYDLDIEKMKQAAKYFVGEHDFVNFCCTRTGVKSTVRTIYELTLQQSGDIITVRVRGNGFLYNMVRMIVGALLCVGRGEYEVVQVKDMLEIPDVPLVKRTAPAHGLVLIGIDYITKGTY